MFFFVQSAIVTWVHAGKQFGPGGIVGSRQHQLVLVSQLEVLFFFT
jgi:hypothetical protein